MVSHKKSPQSPNVKPLSRENASRFARWLMKLSPQTVDVDAINEALGHINLQTLPEVARFFGMQPQTVTQSWRQGGMPGAPGKYPAADVMVWWIERNRREAARDDRAPDPHKARVREIELRVAEIDLRRREREEDEAEGRMIDRGVVVSSLAAVHSMGVEWLTQIADEIEPSLPLDIAADVSGRIRRAIDNTLTRMAEASSRELAIEAQWFEELIQERGIRRLREDAK